MSKLLNQHANLFFLDYSDLALIHGVGNSKGYYDYQHMTPYNNRKLIDAASDTITRAYQTAVRKRAQQP
jgi:hypothetical protein